MINIIKKIFQKLDSISQKKNILFIKKKLGSEINVIIDVGANIGESIYEFNKNPESCTKKRYIEIENGI